MIDTITKIAKEHLNIPTLETRRRDCLDFYDLSVWQIRRALEVAYAEGKKAGGRHAER